MRLNISPASPRPTASGLMIASVRSTAIRSFSRLMICSALPARSLFRLTGGWSLHADLRCIHHVRDRLPDLRGALHGADSGGAQGCIFFRCGALAAADDCAGVAHAAAGRRRLPGDEADHRLLHMLLDEVRGNLFRVAADFADHDDRVRLRIVVEHAHDVQKARADDRIAADADAGGLADAEPAELTDGFVRQRAAAAHDSDVALLVNEAG